MTAAATAASDETDETGEAAGPPRRRGLRVAGFAAGALAVLLVAAGAGLAALSKPIDGHSMEPTLRDGDRVLVAPGSGGTARRFDVVLLQERGATIVKRVIGLPGDRIEIRGTPADPYQVLLQEGGVGPWYRVEVPGWRGRAHAVAGCCTAAGTTSPEPTAQVVPAGKVFFLGDNPDVSADSRKYGWGEMAAIQGRVAGRTWPVGKAGGIGGRPVLVVVDGG